MPRRKTFEEVKAAFEERGYKLISSAYKNNLQKLEYVCSKGHKGFISFGNFQQGKGCSVCSGNKKKTIGEVREVFEARGYKLLTSFYSNGSQKLDYICPNGHKGSMAFNKFKQGQKCPVCAGNRKKTIEEVRKVFEARGYKLVSSFYKNNHQKLDYICPVGHKGSITFHNFQHGQGCSVCGGSKRKTIGEVRETFEARGYKLLTSSYKNAHQKLDYVCPEGHRGSITYASFFSGTGCLVCGYKCAADKQRLLFKTVVDIFEVRGYKVTSLEKDYINTRSKVFYVCPEGHAGSIRASNFIHGQGCSKCAHKKIAAAQKLFYDEVKEYFENYDYTLVSTEYIDSHHKLDYICPKGHEDSMTLDNFKRGQRCPVCAGNKRKTIDEVREAFEAREYKLLTSSYKNVQQKLDYICPKGHKGSITFGNFQQGHRCPVCMRSVSNAELSLRDYVISLVGEDLVKANIQSIIHPWELDIYIPSKKLAIEYCGLYWHSELSGGKARDYHRNKMDLCLEKGIRLITIFEDEFINQPEVVKSRIRNALGCIDTKVYARKTVVKRIDNKVAYKFLEENHLQGKGRASASFGLFYDNRLLQVLTVGHLSRAHASFVDGKKVRMLELKRFASVGDTLVVGGASKLFKHVRDYAVSKGFDYIKSYSDSRYANPFNSVYEKLGFSCVSESRFTPHYVLRENRYRNQALRKTKEERLTGKTEWELRREQGYDRIWDCGHKTFLLEF